MSLATEAMGPGNSSMAAALSAGLDTIDQKQSVAFTLYVKQTLPLDGFVFWLKADQVVNPPAWLTKMPLVLTVEGSLHHATVNTQSEDENFATQRLIFTAKDPVSSLSAMAPNTLYMAEVDGYKYAFSARSNWYRQADLYHYSGDAVYPALADMIIDDIADLDLENRVVSDSMPIWLMFTHARTPAFPNAWELYPAYLLPDNLAPPYAAVNIDERATKPIGAGRFYDTAGNRFQLVTDTVEVSFYGVRNDQILDWIDAVIQYGLDNSTVFGVMNSPVVGDMKRTQVEISTIAQKKTVTFKVCYYQTRLEAIARRYITSAYVGAFYTQYAPPSNGSGSNTSIFLPSPAAVVNPQFTGYGWVDYSDLDKPSPIVLATSVPTAIVRNLAATGPNTNLNFPFAGHAFWDGSKIVARALDDVVSVSLVFAITPQSLGGVLTVALLAGTIDIAPATHVFTAPVGTIENIRLDVRIAVRASFLTNGARLVLTSSVPAMLTEFSPEFYPESIA